MKLKLLSLFSICFRLTMHQVWAQDASGELIQAGSENAHILAKAYLNPMSKAFGTDLNSGWLTSGKVFKPGRFELRLIGSTSFIPAEDQTFNISALGLNTSTRLADTNNNIAPTVFGQSTEGPQVDIYGRRPDNNQEVLVASFNTPAGLGINVAPLPMAQLNIGLVKETEIMMRYLPEIVYDKGKVNMWGVGLKHSIRQWLPVGKALPFDITAAAAYTSFTAGYGLNVEPETEVRGRPVVQSNANFSGQELQLKTKAYYASLVVSKTISVISLYGGFSYSKSESDLVAAGLYPITSVRSKTPTPTSSDTYELYVRELRDPFNITLNHEQLGLTAGFRLKLAFFSFNAEGTLAKYPSATAGIGLGWN